MEASEALKTMRRGVNEVNERVKMLQEIVADYGEGEMGHDGVSLLQLKSVALLRYSANLARFAAERVRGNAPSDELRSELVSDWATLEKIRPLEKRLRPQLDALVKAAHTSTPVHRPNPAAMVGASDSESEASESDKEESNTYVPPRFAPAVYDDDRGENETARAREEARKARMRRGAGARAMLAELRGLPDEIRDTSAVREAPESKARARYEEDNFIRLARTRADRKAAERAQRSSLGGADGGLDELSTFADNVTRKFGKKKSERSFDPETEMTEKIRALDRAENGAETGSRRQRSGGGGRIGSTKKRRRQ